MKKVLNCAIVAIVLTVAGVITTSANAVPYKDGYNEWKGTSYAEYIEIWLLL